VDLSCVWQITDDEGPAVFCVSVMTACLSEHTCVVWTRCQWSHLCCVITQLCLFVNTVILFSFLLGSVSWLIPFDFVFLSVCYVDPYYSRLSVSSLPCGGIMGLQVPPALGVPVLCSRSVWQWHAGLGTQRMNSFGIWKLKASNFHWFVWYFTDGCKNGQRLAGVICFVSCG
jgi:hypothetical protein